MAHALTPFERALLAELAGDGEQTPAALAVALDADIHTLLDILASLGTRGLVTCQGFSTCRLTERGRESLAPNRLSG